MPALTRREMLKRTAAATGAGFALPTLIPASAIGANGAVAPSNRITLGFIGVGDHGVSRNLNGFLGQPDAQAVAVCDVDRSRREAAKRLVEEKYAAAAGRGSFKGCASYNDFRVILARKEIDAVVISTPDHWHVIPAIMAARSGKDVICEKPLTLTVAEGRALSDAMKRHRRIFQTASENRSLPVYHRMCELVRNGRIGKLRSIHVTLPEGRWVRPASREVKPPPEGFDYEMWLGPAPEAPYSEARCHWNFRWIEDYSGGFLTDWGAHLLDIAQWGNDTERTGPVTVEGRGEFPRDGIYDSATKFDLTYTYPNGVVMTVASKEPGIRFVGEEGWIGNTGWNSPLQAEPKSILNSEIKPGETRLYTARDKHRNFLDGVKTRKECYAPAEVGHRTISIAHLGNIAMKRGKKLNWDPKRERFTNDAEANRMLSRPMRSPWKL
ncbi:MAG: Gfo/Idh/MocA family oxidoreductase [Armatimonadetes bacterium]|nr:Gfo/Idh/MocA family oxidoreductase [Armatimonadota bacterium]